MTDPRVDTTSHNGIALGPNSPLLKKPSPGRRIRGTQPAQPKALIARPLDPAGRMNNWEYQRAEQLEQLKGLGLIRAWYFEAIILVLADRTTYRPDFLVVPSDPWHPQTLEEVKGFWREDARVKIKVAARLYPHFAFKALRLPKGATNWVIEDIHP